MRRRHGGTGLHSPSTCGNEVMARCRELFPRCASCGNAGSVQAVALRLKINLVVERNGMRDKGYTFMDSVASGNAIWTFPVALSLFCWNLIPGLISLLAIYCVAVFLLWKYRNVFRIDVGRMVFIGLCTLLTVLVAEAFCAVYLPDSVSEIYQFVIYTFTLVFIISFNFALDRFRIKRFGRRK